MWTCSHCTLINFSLGLSGVLWTILSSRYNEDLYSDAHHTWNAARNRNHMTVLPLRHFHFPLPLPWTPPCASRSYRKQHCPAGQQSIRRMPGKLIPQEEEMPLHGFPRDMKGWHMCERLSETDRERFEESECRLITLQRIYNICKSQDWRTLGNSGCAEVDSQTNESL